MRTASLIRPHGPWWLAAGPPRDGRQQRLARRRPGDCAPLPPRDGQPLDLREAPEIAGGDPVVEPYRSRGDHQVRLADSRTRRRQLGVNTGVDSGDVEVK